jgi:hypothetical protein
MARLPIGGDMRMEITARLIAKGLDQPLHGKDITVKMYDKDFFDDDFLGQGSPDKDGRVHIRFDPARFDRQDPIREKSLDFFFVVYKAGQPIFQSKVMENVDVEAAENFRMGEGEVVDLGTFLI